MVVGGAGFILDYGIWAGRSPARLSSCSVAPGLVEGRGDHGDGALRNRNATVACASSSDPGAALGESWWRGVVVDARSAKTSAWGQLPRAADHVGRSSFLDSKLPSAGGAVDSAEGAEGAGADGAQGGVIHGDSSPSSPGTAASGRGQRTDADDFESNLVAAKEEGLANQKEARHELAAEASKAASGRELEATLSEAESDAKAVAEQQSLGKPGTPQE